VLGDRAERFLLSDAQYVVAQEHGFRNWAEFRAYIQNQRATEDRPVSRLWGQGAGDYASWADALLTELRRGDPGALGRLRAQVPRYAAATDASTAELRDARLIIAREFGFPTWRELVEGAEKSQREAAERQERWRRLRPEAEAMLAGDTSRLAQLSAGQADTLLQMLTVRELLGTKLGPGLGVPRTAAEVLIGKATRLDLLLPAAGWSWSGPASRRTAGCGPPPRGRAPTRPTSSPSQPGTRRHPIRSRSWPRRSSTPASTAGPRSCAGSSTAA